MKRIAALAAALALASCGTGRETGTGSQTGNSIVGGRIATGDATAPMGTRVDLRPLGWTPSQPSDPDRLRNTQLDSNGAFVFREVPPGIYRLEAKKNKKAWSRTLRVAPQVEIALPTATLAPLGSLVCQVRMSDSTRGGRIELYGLDLWDTLPATGSPQVASTFLELPVGIHTVRIWSRSMATVLADIPVRIGPDSSSTIQYDGRKQETAGPVEDEND